MVGILAAAGLWLAGVAPAAAQTTVSSDVLSFWLLDYGLLKYFTPTQSEDVLMGRYEKTFNVQRLAKAQPDEWFYSIAGKTQTPRDPRTPINPTDRTNKVNQAYVWGMAKDGNKLWFGTVPNTACLVGGTYFGGALQPSIAQGGAQVCEYSRSFFSSTNVPGGMHLPAEIGDWRPPELYVYDTKANSLTRIDSGLPPEGLDLVWQTVGFRSATAFRGMILIGGPSFGPDGGINLFAFNSQTGEFLGARSLPKYGNIRKWLVVNDVLYTAVAAYDREIGDFAPGGGWVLRWLDDPNHPDYPFAFEEVGILDGGGSDLCLHEGRLFVDTWPSVTDANMPPQLAQAGLWMSPPLPSGGLRTQHAGQWQKVWQADEYEPDHLIAQTYGMGAMASYGGWLFWGTMHTPATAWAMHYLHYGSVSMTNKLGVLESQLATLRPSNIFRGRDFTGSATPQVQIAYGMYRLPVWDTSANAWTIVPNNMGVPPRFGLAGLGNMYTDYIWTMCVFKDQLYVGTHDGASLAYQPYVDSKTNLQEALTTFLTTGMINTGLQSRVQAELSDPGTDLYRFVSPNLPALQVSKAGLRNYSTYGIRTMITDGTAMYLGMANPRNLWTDPSDEYPEGGWELWRIQKKTIGGAKDRTPVVRPGSTGSKSKTPVSRR